MVTEILVASAISLTFGAVASFIEALLDRWGQQKMPETALAEISDTDKEKIESTKLLINECFGDDVVNCIREASNKERINLMVYFAESLAREYGLDIDVDVTVRDINNFGSYNWEKKRAEFNISLLMEEGENERFDWIVRETIDTIVHELRHAVQHQAIQDKEFWDVDEDRRNSWANNMAPGNYIRPGVDLKGYSSQPIEKDAFTFAVMVMEGVN